MLICLVVVLKSGFYHLVGEKDIPYLVLVLMPSDIY